MKSKGHLWTSLVKSLIRIGGCIVGISNTEIGSAINVFMWCLGIAEVLGIVEELVDLRG